MRKYLVYDKLHKGAVNTCLAASVIGLFFVGAGCFEILTKLRPKIAEEKKLANEELLKEGREVLVDSIATLKA